MWKTGSDCEMYITEISWFLSPYDIYWCYIQSDYLQEAYHETKWQLEAFIMWSRKWWQFCNRWLFNLIKHIPDAIQIISSSEAAHGSHSMHLLVLQLSLKKRILSVVFNELLSRVIVIIQSIVTQFFHYIWLNFYVWLWYVQLHCMAHATYSDIWPHQIREYLRYMWLCMTKEGVPKMCVMSCRNIKSLK